MLMKLSPGCLPQELDNAACHDFIASAPLAAWMPALAQIQGEFDLPDAPWQKIPKGSNALFALGDSVIIKLVPPNWRRQGDKELLVTPMLEDRLSLTTPRLIGGGEIDNWVFVISTRLSGTPLADIWLALPREQKRSIMVQTGEVLREFRAVPFAEDIAIRVNWPSYIDGLISSCVARHQRRNMPADLVSQVLPYIESAGDFTAPGEARFIHMDFHPWNLMAKEVGGQWRLDGLLDFGDAIVGHSDRFELLTPMMFMAQGDPVLAKTLLQSYGMNEVDAPTLQRQLTATMLIRPDSDVTFCMQQVPATAPRDTWHQIAVQIFPM
jgi:hygromycin-B 7''-O-kinase